jgi:hypothetical protein
MDNRYTVINSCLKLLKTSSWSTTKRLRVEIKLIKIKRYLLNDDPESTSGSCDEAIFEALLCQMNSIKAAKWQREAYPPLLQSLAEIISALPTDGEDEPTSHYDTISGLLDR